MDEGQLRNAIEHTFARFGSAQLLHKDRDLLQKRLVRREGHDGRGTASYLLGEPMLGDLLAEGLEEFGVSWTDERTTPVR